MEHLQRSVSKTSRKLSKRLKKLIRKKPLVQPLILLFIGLGLLTFGGINYYRVRILSFNKVPEAARQTTQNIDVPVEIIIPSIKIDLPIDPAQIKDGVWQISESNATFLTTSAPPRTGGNTVVYGHNKTVIFGNLPYVSIGQKVTLKTKSGKIYNYEVAEKFFVGPDRVDLVSPANTEELTIYTCWGLFDGQRAVIRAKPLF